MQPSRDILEVFLLVGCCSTPIATNKAVESRTQVLQAQYWQKWAAKGTLVLQQLNDSAVGAMTLVSVERHLQSEISIDVPK